MSNGTVDNVKGKIKEAAAVLTEDDELKREGKIDQAVGTVKNAVEKVSDWAVCDTLATQGIRKIATKHRDEVVVRCWDRPSRKCSTPIAMR